LCAQQFERGRDARGPFRMARSVIAGATFVRDDIHRENSTTDEHRWTKLFWSAAVPAAAATTMVRLRIICALVQRVTVLRLGQPRAFAFEFCFCLRRRYSGRTRKPVMKIKLSPTLTLSLFLAASLLSSRAWDYEGHRAVNQLALAALPTNFPA